MLEQPYKYNCPQYKDVTKYFFKDMSTMFLRWSLSELNSDSEDKADSEDNDDIADSDEIEDRTDNEEGKVGVSNTVALKL